MIIKLCGDNKIPVFLLLSLVVEKRYAKWREKGIEKNVLQGL